MVARGIRGCEYVMHAVSVPYRHMRTRMVSCVSSFICRSLRSTHAQYVLRSMLCCYCSCFCLALHVVHEDDRPAACSPSPHLHHRMEVCMAGRVCLSRLQTDEKRHTKLRNNKEQGLDFGVCACVFSQFKALLEFDCFFRPDPELLKTDIPDAASTGGWWGRLAPRPPASGQVLGHRALLTLNPNPPWCPGATAQLAPAGSGSRPPHIERHAAPVRKSLWGSAQWMHIGRHAAPVGKSLEGRALCIPAPFSQT